MLCAFTARFTHTRRLGPLRQLCSLHSHLTHKSSIPYEPLMMDPYTTIYVNDGSCSAGKVLKVQGTPRNQRRKKSCVPMDELQGALRSGSSR